MGTILPPAAPAVLRPSRVRYGVLAYLCLLAFVLYLDRVCIGQAGPLIKRDLGLNDTQMGFVFGAFTLAYGLFQVSVGRLGDRFGSRGVLVGIVLWWSAFTALTGAATGFVLLLAIRFIFGLGEAGALPNSARVLARWFPPQDRGLPQGLINTAMLVGGAFAPVVAAYLIAFLDGKGGDAAQSVFGLRPIGWRWAFVVFGSLGLLWALAFWLWYRDDPARHPQVNAAERDYILARPEGDHSAKGDHPAIPWERVVRCPTVWLMGAIISCASFASYMYMSWYPTYLQEGRMVSAERSSWLAGLVLAGGAVGSTLGGLLGDWLVRRTGGRRVRKFLGAGAMATAAGCIVLSLACDSAVGATVLTSLACFSAMLMIAPWWAVVADISGPHVGALFGLMNSIGVIGAFGSQVFFGWMADHMKGLGYSGRAQWDPAFYVYGAVLLAGALCWLLIDVNRSAVAEEKDEG